MFESIERVRERECVQESGEKERAAMAAALLPLQQLQHTKENSKLSRVDVIFLLYVLCCNPFSIYNKMKLFPVDVGDFVESRKILCQCALALHLSKYQNTTGPGIPPTIYIYIYIYIFP